MQTMYELGWWIVRDDHHGNAKECYTYFNAIMCHEYAITHSDCYADAADQYEGSRIKGVDSQIVEYIIINNGIA